MTTERATRSGQPTNYREKHIIIMNTEEIDLRFSGVFPAGRARARGNGKDRINRKKTGRTAGSTIDDRVRRRNALDDRPPSSLRDSRFPNGELRVGLCAATRPFATVVNRLQTNIPRAAAFFDKRQKFLRVIWLLPNKLWARARSTRTTHV